MDTTIDTLAIEIETESSGSLKAIDNIIEKLNKLDGVLQRNASSISRFKSSLSGLNGIKVNDIKMPKVKIEAEVKPKVTSTASASALGGGDKTYKQPDMKSNESAINRLRKHLQGAKQDAEQTQKAIDKINVATNKVGKSAGKNLTNMTKHFRRVTKESNKLSTALKKSFSTSLAGGVRKFGLALVGVRSLFTATRSAVQEYMNYDTQLRDTLRNNWAVLGSLIAPVLETVIALFGKAVAYIRAFIKALTGIDLVARANSKAVDALGDSAKNTLGSLAKFDNLNVVEFPTNSGGSDEMKPLTTPEIDTSSLDLFIEKIKAGDWYGLGMEIGRLFNDGLRTIDFDWFIDKAREWATNVADLLNGLTDGTDWNLLGEKFAGGLNTVFTFVNTFFDRYNWSNLGTSVSTGLNSMIGDVDWDGFGQLFANKIVAVFDFLYNAVNTFDFESLGESLSTSINSFVSKIDWGKAGTSLVDGFFGVVDTIRTALQNIDWGNVASSISDGLNGMLDSAISYIQNTDWSEVAQTTYDKIVEFLSNVDWSGIVSKIFELLGSAVTASYTMIGTFVENIVTAIADYFSQYIEEGDDWQETGRNIILGVFEGIANAIKNIGTWIYDNVLVPFIDGFKEAFDIHSPSKVMAEQGKFVWEGFLSAFTNVKESIKQKWDEVKSGIKEKITEIIADIKNTFSKKNIENTFNTVKTTITDKFTEIKNNIKTKMSEAWTNLTTAFSVSKIGKHFQKVFDKIKSIFKTVGTTVGNAVGESFANVINTVIGFVEKTINKFIKAINKAIGVINEIPGVSIKKLDTIDIPDVKLATGTNRIESEGLYHLHKNEAVVPEKYNPAVNDDLYNNRGVIEALGRVYDAINALEMTNVVNVGNKTLYKETVNYAKKQNQIYGETVVTI